MISKLKVYKLTSNYNKLFLLLSIKNIIDTFYIQQTLCELTIKKYIVDLSI